MTTSKNKLLFLLPTLILIISLIGYYFFFRSYSVTDITADNYRSLLKETNDAITLDDISPGTQKDLHMLYANQFGEQDNGTIKISRLEQDNNLQIDYKTKITYLRYTTNWKGANYDKLWSYYVTDYFMANDFLPSTPQEIKNIADVLIIKEGFILKESNLKDGGDILIKETKDAFIISRLTGSYSGNSILSMAMSKYSKKK